MSTVITNPHLILRYSRRVLRMSLFLETQGMKRRGRPASVIVREVIGSTTRNKQSLLAEYDAWFKKEYGDDPITTGVEQRPLA
jgi:hypothetical protein